MYLYPYNLHNNNNINHLRTLPLIRLFFPKPSILPFIVFDPFRWVKF